MELPLPIKFGVKATMNLPIGRCTQSLFLFQTGIPYNQLPLELAILKAKNLQKITLLKINSIEI